MARNPFDENYEEMFNEETELAPSVPVDMNSLVTKELDDIAAAEAAMPQIPLQQDPVEPQTIPAMQESKPLSREDLLATYRSLKGAQDSYGQDLSNLAMLQGANQIAQGFARGFGANIDDGSKGIEALKAASKEKVDAVGRKLNTASDTMKAQNQLMTLEEEEKMSDPNSDISKLYREQAYALLKRMNPNSPLMGKLDDMSASQLEKLGFKGLGEQGKSDNRYVTIQDEDGTIRSKVINMATGETVKDLGLAGYAYGTMINPRTKEPVRLSKSDPRQAASAITGTAGSTPVQQPVSDQPQKRNPYEIKNSLNVYDRDILDKDVSEFQKEIKDEKRIISEIGAISDSTVNLAKKNPNAAKTLGAQVAKIMQGSRLTDADVRLYTGREGVLNKLEDFATEALTGTISDAKAKDITQVLNYYNDALRKSLENRANQAAAITVQNYDPNMGITPDEIAPLYYVSDKNVQKKQPTQNKPKAGSIVTVKGKQYKVAEDGDTLIPLNK